MEDQQIVDLFWNRSEAAIAETEVKYGTYCFWISYNLLFSAEDAKECVNDVYLQLWNMIPPHRPDKLKPLLGRIVRSISINRWHKNHAQKRDSGLAQSLEELSETIPSSQDLQQEVEDSQLSTAITQWLYTLPAEDRKLFLRRYWYGVALQDLAREMQTAPQKLAQKMYRMRKGLRTYLEETL